MSNAVQDAHNNLFDPTTGLRIGYVDQNGKEQLDFDSRFVPPGFSGPYIGFLGASIELRNCCLYSTTGSYTRVGGAASIALANVFNSTSLMRRFKGHEIHVSCLTHPEIEGIFNLSADTTDNGSITQLAWNDPRPDTSFFSGSQAVNIVDRQSFCFSSAIPAFMSAALGGRVRCSSMGVSGAEVFDMYGTYGLTTRLGLFASKGPYDIVVLGGGVIGNSVVSAQTNTGADDLYSQVVALCQKIKTLTGCKFLVITTNWNPGIAPTSDSYTRGTIIGRRLYDQLVKDCPWVRIAQAGEAMATSWQASPTVAPGANTLYGYPPSEWLDGTGPHLAQRGSMRVGQSLAAVLKNLINSWVPCTLAYGDCRSINTAADKNGDLNPSIVSNWFGAISSTPLSGTGVSGNGPPNVTVTWSTRANAVVVGSLATEPEIGNVFRLTVTDNGAQSPLGALLQIQWAPPELLTWLNSTDSNNALVDLYMPIEVKGQADVSLCGVQLALVAAGADGVVRGIAAPLLDQGDKTMYNLQRHMGDEGLSGLAFRAPRVRLPNNITFTSAYFLWTVHHCGTNQFSPNPPGTYTVTLFPTTRLEKIAG